ncbi:hypothetical protein GGI07_000620 [Coemansia sp. Benny D115]|nr:hypothetical protein GGI07_000620 [Coemansia sp. Benny D115]
MAQKLAEGKLDVQVVAGRDLPRRSLFGRRDSAVELSLGTVRKRTQADRNGGAAPQWNDRVSFTVSGLGKTQLAVRALEIESSISDKTIGSCVIDLTRIFVEEEVDSWYALKFNDKPAGSVYLEFTFTPKGGRKNIKKDPLLEEEEYSAFKPEPKLPKSSDTVASAPSLLQQGSGPHTGDARPSPHLSAVSTLAPVPMRPSTSDMRPYSSASMHNPDLAIKYANKHGTKPLPSAPAVGFVAPGSIPDASMAMQQQPLPMAGYDQTMMPGQAPFAAQQYQQRMSYHPDMGTMYQQQPGMTMGPAQVQPQRIQPQEHQSLANMFAPLPQDDVSAMARPQSTMAAVAPGYNPAYVAVTDPQQQQQQQIVMQQQVPMGKQLPLPPGQPVSGAPVMVMMAVDPNAPHMTQQVQLISYDVF